MVPPPTVIHQTLNRETVIINLDNGRYYSLNPIGSAIWMELLASASPLEISSTLAESNPASAATIPAQVSQFVNELMGEDLLIPSQAPARTAPPNADLTAAPYTPPELTTFTDTEDLIPLDPIHEVGALGWPHKATDTP